MKKRYSFATTLGVLFALLTAVSCTKNAEFVVKEGEQDLQFEKELFLEDYFRDFPFRKPFDYQAELPKYLTAIGLQAPQIDDYKATVGRVLFYDTQLSRTGKVACASCHKAELGFGDNLKVSPGVDGKLGKRNASALANVANFGAHYQQTGNVFPQLLWDSRVESVAELSKLAFTSPNEMDIPMSQVVEKIKNLDYYKIMFERVYADGRVSEERILDCLSEFVAAIGSAKSKLDTGLDGVNGELDKADGELITQVNKKFIIQQAYYGGGDTTVIIDTIVFPRPGVKNLNPSENRGRAIFIANCTKCHSPVRPFQEVFMACNGLDMIYKDKGLAEITGRAEDEGVFKAPSLRNIFLTAPFMHDGRFATLDAVIDFYSDKIANHPNLHPLLKKNGDPRLNLTAQQKQDLKTFLHTMTDNSLRNDTRFSNPFH